MEGLEVEHSLGVCSWRNRCQPPCLTRACTHTHTGKQALWHTNMCRHIFSCTYAKHIDEITDTLHALCCCCSPVCSHFASHSVWSPGLLVLFDYSCIIKGNKKTSSISNLPLDNCILFDHIFDDVFVEFYFCCRDKVIKWLVLSPHSETWSVPGSYVAWIQESMWLLFMSSDFFPTHFVDWLL